MHVVRFGVPHVAIGQSTTANKLVIMDIGRRDPKQIVPGRAMDESYECLTSLYDCRLHLMLSCLIIKDIKLNCNGTKLAVLCSRLDGEYLWLHPLSDIAWVPSFRRADSGFKGSSRVMSRFAFLVQDP